MYTNVYFHEQGNAARKGNSFYFVCLRITVFICKNRRALSKDYFVDSPNNLFLHSYQSIAVTCTAVSARDGISNTGNSNRISGGIQGDS